MSDQNGHDSTPIQVAARDGESPLVNATARKRVRTFTSIPAASVWPNCDPGVGSLPAFSWVLVDNRGAVDLYVDHDQTPSTDKMRYVRRVPAGTARVFNVGPPVQHSLRVLNSDGSSSCNAVIELSMDPIVDFQQTPRLVDGSGNLISSVAAQADATSSDVLLEVAAEGMAYDSGGGGRPARVFTPRTVGASADAGGHAFTVAQQLYNGTNFDLQQNNSQGTLLASAARTTLTESAQQVNYNARGLLIQLNVTVASGTGGLTPVIIVTDAASIDYQLNVSPTGITATGGKQLIIYPGVAALNQAPNVYQVANAPLPRLWRFRMNVGDASSYTYSVAYAYIL